MSSCPPPPFSFSRALKLRCRLRPPATTGDLPRAGSKAAPPVVRPPSRRLKGCTARRPSSPSPCCSGELSALSPCRAAPPSPPVLMPRRLRLLAGQHGVTNHVTVGAPAATTSFGTRVHRVIGSGCPAVVGHLAAGSCVRRPSPWARRPAWYCSTFLFNDFLDLRSPENLLYL
jgi:hypothetical protein